jgi:DNA uptake protein ComE-like DNA-binding protein
MSGFAAALTRRSGRLVAVSALAAAAVGVGAVMTSRGSDQAAPAAIPAVAAPGPAATLLVFVSGAVLHPGLYGLATGARIADAIADAGGILPTADPGKLPNLSALLHDGHQVNVPFAKGSSARTSAKIDVNSADVTELETIPGITSDLAQAIVDTRTQWGPRVLVAGAASWTLGGTAVRCIPSGPAPAAPCLLQLSDGRSTALVTGNLAQAAQDEVAAVQRSGLRADLLVAPTTTAPSAALVAAARPALVAAPAKRSPPGLGALGLEVAITGRDSDLEYDALPDGGFANPIG